MWVEKWSAIIVDSLGIVQGIIMLDNKVDWVLLLEVHRPRGYISYNNNLNNFKAKNYNKGDHSNFNSRKPLPPTPLFHV